MYIKINSVTNGFLSNYPKFIFISYFKHKHWRELTLANDLDNEAFEDVLTSVFDDVIDFEKTGFIKTSDELIVADRLKLFLFQIVNQKTDKLKLRYTCTNENCKGEFDLTVDLLSFKEIKLNKKVENLFLDDEKRYYFKIPNREDFRNQAKMVISYKERILEEIRKLRENFDGDEDDLKSEIKKLLDKFYIVYKDNIKIVQDIDFDNYTTELIAVMGFIGGLEINDLGYYLNFMYNDNVINYKNLIKFVTENVVGYDMKIKFKCKHCGKNYEEELPVLPKFFFM